ncbi:MAG: hypothetical protein CK430_15150 [Legionella sp.]|nr:MAG: hypothetical protein CK430_15150 [Legionella sp.]
MGLRELLDHLESMPVPSVPSESSSQGTAKTQYYQGGSLCSPGSLQIFTDQAESDLEKTTNINVIKNLCECGYRPPFCTCGFYKFPSQSKGEIS